MCRVYCCFYCVVCWVPQFFTCLCKIEREKKNRNECNTVWNTLIEPNWLFQYRFAHYSVINNCRTFRASVKLNNDYFIRSFPFYSTERFRSCFAVVVVVVLNFFFEAMRFSLGKQKNDKGRRFVNVIIGIVCWRNKKITVTGFYSMHRISVNGFFFCLGERNWKISRSKIIHCGRLATEFFNWKW